MGKAERDKGQRLAPHIACDECLLVDRLAGGDLVYTDSFHTCCFCAEASNVIAVTTDYRPKQLMCADFWHDKEPLLETLGRDADG